MFSTKKSDVSNNIICKVHFLLLYISYLFLFYIIYIISKHFLSFRFIIQKNILKNNSIMMN